MLSALSDKVHILLYADDSKLISALNDSMDAHCTQAKLDKLVNWANTWLMELNLDKCKVMHFGYRLDLPLFDYTMINANDDHHQVTCTGEERDLGIQVTVDLKWHSQCTSAASRASRVLGSLSRTFVCRDTKLWRFLYVSLVRPHLEFAAPIWNNNSNADITVLERV